MKTRSILALTIVAGMATAASAQTATVTLNWKNLTTGAQDPLQPGQRAAIWADVNVNSASGQVFDGVATLFMDLIGSNDGSGAWTFTGLGFGGTPNIDGPLTNTNADAFGRRIDLYGGWALGGVGTAQPNGDVMAAQAGQFPPTGVPANTFNPVREIWRAAWEPADYSARTVTFDSRKADASPNTGVAYYIDVSGSRQTVHVPLSSVNWGSVNIPIIPSPSSLALLGLGGLIATRRRR